MKTISLVPIAVLAVLTLSACPGASTDDGADTDMATSGETEGFACDPEGQNPEVGELLNAPVADDVEVIVKTPQHPDAPGPDNLP